VCYYLLRSSLASSYGSHLSGVSCIISTLSAHVILTANFHELSDILPLQTETSHHYGQVIYLDSRG
jgi:hypothetical protein